MIIAATEYPGIDGFLGTRGSVMLDIVFLAMFFVVPTMLFGIYQARYRKNYALHKKIQLSLGVVLLITITLFELDMRFGGGWQERATASPYYGSDEDWGSLWTLLFVHLIFAVSTTILWIFVSVRALKKFPKPPVPCEYSPRHIFWARLTAVVTTLAASTGCVFYWMAFSAT